MKRLLATTTLALLVSPAAAKDGTLVMRLRSAAVVRCDGSFVEVGREGTLSTPARETKPERKVALPSLRVPPEGTAAGRLSLPPGQWEVRLRSTRCWSPIKKVEVAPGSNRELELAVRPLGEAFGKVALPAGVPMPGAVEARFQDESKQVEGTTFCPVATGVLSCRLPAAQGLRLRVSTKGFAPAYRWDLAVSAGRRSDIGTVVFERGGVLLGSAVTAAGVPLPDGSHASLIPRGLEGIEAADRDLVQRRVSVGARGRFQIRASQGEYLLEVTAQGYAPASVHVRVIDSEEAWLRHPLVLSAPLTAQIQLSPPVDPRGEQWRIFLGRLDRYRAGVAPVVDGAKVGYDGWFERTGVGEGTYLLKVLDQRGSVWHGGEVEIAAESMPLAVEIGAIKIHGRVTIGRDEPLAAILWFGGRSGVPKLRVESDQKGYFQGVLPRSGTWRVDVDGAKFPVRRRIEDVLVAARLGSAEAEVNIDLPANELSGSVVFEDGSAPPASVVMIVPQGDEVGFTSVPLKDTNRFTSIGLKPGVTRVSAQAPRRGAGGDVGNYRSDEVIVTLPESGSVEGLTLVLRSVRTVKGRVASGGRPVPGAQLSVTPVGDFSGFAPVFTSADGAFEVEVPGRTRHVTAVVAGIGRTLLVTNATLAEDGQLDIDLPATGGTVSIGREELVPVAESAPYTVLMRNGIPIPMYWLVTWQRLHGDEQAVGSVTLPNLAAGNYQLCTVPREHTNRSDYHAPGFPGKCVSGTLLAGGHLQLRPEGG